MLLYIRTHWYPCRNPQECAEQAQLFQEQMRVDLQFGRQQLYALLNSTPHSITASDATVEQLATAGFSYREVVGAVRQGGDQGTLIEWIEGVTNHSDLAIDMPASTLLVIRGAVGGGTDARPLHVVCGFRPRPRRGRCWDLRVLLAYDPSGGAYRGKWSNDYTRRICFCPPEGVEEDPTWRRRERLRTSVSSARVVYTTGDTR
ncbi:MAG: hypothetical protein ACRDOE_01695 [Streptosporangiaceae bacterium]